MSLAAFQRDICRIIAAERVSRGVSYIAGGSALNMVTSRDIDIFHDLSSAVEASWEADREVLESLGFMVTPVRLRAGYAEAIVSKVNEQVTLQWTAGSAFRFFPLIEHEDFGLTLHPFDLASNKVLALVGRLEVRDWVDLLARHRTIQPLGYLAWAASGKDPGFSPAGIIEHASRSARYTQIEIDSLTFEGPTPDAAALSIEWRLALQEARDLIELLPPEQAGKCVLDPARELFREGTVGMAEHLAGQGLFFHEGSLQGSMPTVKQA